MLTAFSSARSDISWTQWSQISGVPKTWHSNLSLDLAITPWEPQLGGFTIRVEDVAALASEVERNLTHLITARRLINCAGIVVGEHTRCQLVAPNRA